MESMGAERVSATPEQGGTHSNRALPREPVEAEVRLDLLDHGTCASCELLDLSMGGCRLRMLHSQVCGINSRVEVSFRVRGCTFRIGGLSVWADELGRVGIKFQQISSRRAAELAEILKEVSEMNRARAEREAAQAEAALELSSVEDVESAQPDAACDSHTLTGEPEEPRGSRPSILSQPINPSIYRMLYPERSLLQAGDRGVVATGPLGHQENPAARPTSAYQEPRLSVWDGGERRSHQRFNYGALAIVHLTRGAGKIEGEILNLSHGGCSIKTDGQFPVGIFTPVETEFCAEGHPFRLGGVVQAIHERDTVGIRFLDVSKRKQAQLSWLIDELKNRRSRTRG